MSYFIQENSITSLWHVVSHNRNNVIELPPSKILEEFYQDKEELNLEWRKCNQTQLQRLKLLKKGCEELDFNLLKPDPVNIFKNDPRKLAICTPHKVGSQTWRYFFQQLDLQDRNFDEKGEELYYVESIQGQFRHYLKAFQVRHPLERLLSSYRFIFERSQMKSTLISINKHIYEKYTNQSMENYDAYEFTPSFKQFCQFVADSPDDFGLSQFISVSHWLPFYMQCNPCHEGK